MSRVAPGRRAPPGSIGRSIQIARRRVIAHVSPRARELGAMVVQNPTHLSLPHVFAERPGRFADLAVLSQDIFSVVPPEAMVETTSELTMVGGEIVWDSGALDLSGGAR